VKAAIADGRGNVEVKEVPDPVPGPYQCLCKTLACATCTGTDQKIVDGKLFPGMKYPGILGHESYGKVISCGSKVRNIHEGEMFLRPIAAYHGELLGGYHSCWGGFSEYGLVTDVKALLEDDKNAAAPFYCKYQQQVPAELQLTPAQATMLVTQKELAGYIKNVEVRDGSSILVLGAGSVAMSMCFFAKLKGAFPVIVVGRRDDALADCMKAGADSVINNAKEDLVEQVRKITDGKGVSFVLDAAGDAGMLAKSASCLASSGKISIYATRGGGSLELNNFQGPSSWKFEFNGPDEAGSHQYLLDLVRLKAVNLDLFYSHRIPLSEFKEGFALLRSKKAYKIVFEM